MEDIRCAMAMYRAGSVDLPDLLEGILRIFQIHSLQGGEVDSGFEMRVYNKLIDLENEQQWFRLYAPLKLPYERNKVCEYLDRVLDK